MAGENLERLETRYGHRVGRVHIVLADNEDDPNGFATTVTYRILGPESGPESGGRE